MTQTPLSPLYLNLMHEEVHPKTIILEYWVLCSFQKPPELHPNTLLEKTVQRFCFKKTPNNELKASGNFQGNGNTYHKSIPSGVRGTLPNHVTITPESVALVK